MSGLRADGVTVRRGGRAILDGVTAAASPGTFTAVIGPNGAGKSTLLQALAGIITPSAGVIDVRGQVSSLLTLGAGFDQDLTGRENIWLAGAFMGMSHTEMARRIEGIVGRQAADLLRRGEVGRQVDADAVRTEDPRDDGRLL